MQSLTPQLPTILGSFAGMLVAFLGLLSGTSPGTCLMKAAAAFVVFAGLGLIVRYALIENADENGSAGLAGNADGRAGLSNLDVIVPGTSVADLLATQAPLQDAEGTGEETANQQAAA